jgi:hypothetical protein
MKKIILTENQLQKVESQIIKESADYKFQETVKFDIDYYGVTYKGEEIDWVDDVQFDITFLIDMEYRRYGIKSISVYGFTGPDSVEIEITPRVDDADSETVTLPLRWNDDDFVQTEEREDLGWIGVDNDATLKLANDENGNLYIDFVSFEIKSI